MYRWLVLFLGLPILLVGVSGCGGDDSKSKPTIQKQTQATENSKAANTQKLKPE